MIDDFSPYTPYFGQSDAVSLTQADRDTLDNWIRYKHVTPERVGKRRMFTFMDLLIIDFTWMMAKTFKADIDVASQIGIEAAKSYRDWIDSDRDDIERGQSWSAVSHDNDFHFTLTRDADGLRAVRDGDMEIDSVMVVLPVRMIGRRLLHNCRLWADAV